MKLCTCTFTKYIIYEIYGIIKHVAMGFVPEIKYLESCRLLCKTIMNCV